MSTWYCYRCGGFTNMVGTGHGEGKCERKPELVSLIISTLAIHERKPIPRAGDICGCGKTYDEPHFANIIYDCQQKFKEL